MMEMRRKSRMLLHSPKTTLSTRCTARSQGSMRTRWRPARLRSLRSPVTRVICCSAGSVGTGPRSQSTVPPSTQIMTKVPINLFLDNINTVYFYNPSFCLKHTYTSIYMTDVFKIYMNKAIKNLPGSKNKFQLSYTRVLQAGVDSLGRLWRWYRSP